MLPDSFATFQSVDNDITGSDIDNTVDVITSPRSADSEPDINAHAEAMVQSMESGRLLVQEGLTKNVADGEPKHPENSATDQVPQPLMLTSSSTSIPFDDGVLYHAGLAVESALRVAIAPG